MLLDFDLPAPNSSRRLATTLETALRPRGLLSGEAVPDGEDSPEFADDPAGDAEGDELQGGFDLGDFGLDDEEAVPERGDFCWDEPPDEA